MVNENKCSFTLFNTAGLEKVDIVNLICQLLQVSQTPKTLCELIHRKSQGFPSWCEQLIKDALYATTIQIITKPSGTGNLLNILLKTLKTSFQRNEFELLYTIQIIAKPGAFWFHFEILSGMLRSFIISRNISKSMLSVPITSQITKSFSFF